MNLIEEQFLTDIRNNSKDDTPRLIYADWLMDNGHEDRGRFIKAQILGEELDYGLRIWMDNCGWMNEQHEWIRSRPSTPDPNYKYVWENYNKDNSETLSASHTVICKLRDIELTFRRGFVEEIKVPCLVWEQYAGFLTTNYYLKRAGLTNRQPQIEVLSYKNEDKPCNWFNEGVYSHTIPSNYILRSFLPVQFFIRLRYGERLSDSRRRYSNWQEAFNDLSQALLEYGGIEATRINQLKLKGDIPLPIKKNDFEFPKDTLKSVSLGKLQIKKFE